MAWKVKDGQRVKKDGKVYNGGDVVPDPDDALKQSGAIEQPKDGQKDVPTPQAKKD